MYLPRLSLVAVKVIKMGPIEYNYDGLNGDDANYGWQSLDGLDSEGYQPPAIPSANDFFDNPSEFDTDFWN